LFIAWIIAWIAAMIVGWIPILGSVVMMVLYLGVLLLWVIGIIYSLSGEMKEIPLIGQYARMIKL